MSPTWLHSCGYFVISSPIVVSIRLDSRRSAMWLFASRSSLFEKTFLLERVRGLDQVSRDGDMPRKRFLFPRRWEPTDHLEHLLHLPCGRHATLLLGILELFPNFELLHRVSQNFLQELATPAHASCAHSTTPGPRRLCRSPDETCRRRGTWHSGCRTPTCEPG